jgi:hypothetical protein
MAMASTDQPDDALGGRIAGQAGGARPDRWNPDRDGSHVHPRSPRPTLPSPRGALSGHVTRYLRGHRTWVPQVDPIADPLVDDDLQLALYLCYELHYRSFADVPDGMEWDSSLLAFRAELERAFELRLLEESCGHTHPPIDQSVERELSDLIASAGGPSLSTYLLQEGSLAQMREFAMHRSAYQRKEADPHTWAIPRLDGPAKAALVRIQADEYGFGEHRAMHQHLFGITMRELGLDPSYGVYVERLPGSTLAAVNVISLFGLHRRWRGALVGHLTVYEMTSVVPMARYSAALARLGVNDAARRFYDVHVSADAEHEEIALHDMAGSLARQEPSLRADIVFGARAALAVEARQTQHLLDSWTGGRSSLRPSASSAAARSTARLGVSSG